METQKNLIDVLALVGKSNSGKTSAMKYAILKLLQDENRRIDLISYSKYGKGVDKKQLSKRINEDFETVKGNISDISILIIIDECKVLITTQGDSYKDLKNMFDKHKDDIDVFVCCRHKNNDLNIEFPDCRCCYIEHKSIRNGKNMDKEFEEYKKHNDKTAKKIVDKIVELCNDLCSK